MVKDLNDPTNVDTIPAMLTDGEFVLNKEATAMYGPIIEQMNNHGLQQRHAENQMLKANIGKKVSKLHGEGYTAPGQAYAIAKSMGYNTGGLVGFLKEKEGYRDKAYQDQAGVWTIGYGRTTNPDGSPIKPGQTTSKEKEDSWLNKRAASERAAVEKYAEKHGYDWSEGQKDALASFRYNVGNLDQLTQGGKRSNDEIVQALPQYNKAGGEVSEGLVNRRNAELQMWGTEGRKPSAPPPAEAPPQVGFDPMQLAQLAIPQRQPMMPAQHVGLRGRNPEYIESLAAGGVSTYNGGGSVQYLRNGGRANITEEERERRRLARLAGANNVSRGRNQARVAPQQQVAPPPRTYQDTSIQPLPTQIDQNPYGSTQIGRHYGNIVNQQDNKQAWTVPEVDNQPPVPGTDEAILQGSSQAVEGQEDWTSMVDPQDLAAAGFDQTGNLASTGSGAIDSGIIGPDSVPSPEYVDAQIQGGFTSPEQVQAAQDYVGPTVPQMGEAPQIPGPVGAALAAPEEAAPAVDTKPPEKSAGPDEQRVGIKNAQSNSNERAPSVTPEQRTEIVDKGRAMGERMTEPERNKVASTLKETFGDLFDKKELARMGVLMLGGIATGMSPGQALAFAGTQYLNRIDAKEANYQQVAASGKYTKQSVAEYKKTGDPNVLAAVGTPPERTGNFVTKYDSKGKPVQLEEVKVGKSTYLQDAQGNIRSGFDFKADPSEVRGSPEYRTRVKQATSNIEGQLKEMRDTFDVYDKESGGANTDILPSTNANKVAQWAVDNGVSPDELGGLVESAYHDAINDKRQDGSRARDLVPYLQQLVVRQQVGGNSEVFKSKDQAKDGPPKYVNPAKLQKLNAAASNLLKSMGHKGGVNDLSNIFYTEALKDWNGLDADTKKQWQRKAQGDESGFYLFAEHMLTVGV